MFGRHYGGESVLKMSSNSLFCTHFRGVCGVMTNITFWTHVGAFSKREKSVVSEVLGGAKGVLDRCAPLAVCPRGAPPLHTTPHLELKLPTRSHSLSDTFRHLVRRVSTTAGVCEKRCVQEVVPTFASEPGQDGHTSTLGTPTMLV